MRTWREINVEARARGWYSDEERRLWNDGQTCLVGEYRKRYGVDCDMNMGLGDTTSFGPAGELLTPSVQLQILTAMQTHDFDEFDRLIDFVEDRALQLKREGRTSHGRS